MPGRGIKPLVSLRAHPRIAIAAFLLTLLIGIPLVLIKGQVFYAATSVIQVAPRYMKNLRDDGELDFPSNTQYREFLEQQTRSVARYDIVRDALLSLGDKASHWRQAGDSERKSVDRLRDSLIVRSIPDTYMIEVQLRSDDKSALAEIVNAIVVTYVERMRKERVFGSEERIRMLEAREVEILQSIREGTEKRTALALQLGIGSFTGKEENPYDRVLAQLRSSLTDARGRRFDAESQLKAFETNGETDTKTRSVQEAVLIDPGLSSLKSNLFKRRADLLAQLSGLQPEHPAYQELAAELARIEVEVASQTAKLKDQVYSSVHARFKTAVDQASRLESSLRGDFAELEQKGASFASLHNQAMTLTYELEHQRKELDAIRERLNHFAAEQNSFGFVRMVTPALPPEMAYGMGKKKIALAVLLAALFMAGALPLAVDLVDRRIHTVNAAENVLGIPALGWMVERGDEATKLFGDDLLRRIAGTLANEREKHGTKVFAFSSVKPAGGASEMVLALARDLDALGFRALAVEANGFRKDTRYASERPGLAECLRGDAAPAACVDAARGDLPARVAIGDLHGRNHLDRLDRINEVIEGWAEEFDFVLVDLPPLLVSADAEILARKLAHLIVVVEANETVAGELRRAGRLLEKLDPSAVGIIVNRVRPFVGGGYLRGTMLEYLSGRKLSEYFTVSSWMLGVQAEWVALQLRFPALGAALRRLSMLLAMVSMRHPRPRAIVQPTHGTETVRKSRRPLVNVLLVALVAAMLATVAYLMTRHPLPIIEKFYEGDLVKGLLKPRAAAGDDVPSASNGAPTTTAHADRQIPSQRLQASTTPTF